MIVIDASVLIEMLMRTPEAQAIEGRVFDGGEPLHAPHIIDVEVAQVLRRFVIRGQLDAKTGHSLLQTMGAMPLTRHVHRDLVLRAWTLRENVTAYDGVYVALADTLGATLLTRDGRLARALGERVRVEVI